MGEGPYKHKWRAILFEKQDGLRLEITTIDHDLLKLDVMRKMRPLNTIERKIKTLRIKRAIEIIRELGVQK